MCIRDSYLNTKIKKKTRNTDKIEKKVHIKLGQYSKTYYFDIVVGDQIVAANLMGVLPSEQILGPSMRKSNSSYRALRQVKKKTEREKVSYEDLGIDSPKPEAYDGYTAEWCRYCGARYSSNFTKGPWGPRTLCTIHYIEWNQKKKLDLSSYQQIPKRPINLDANTELNYLANMKNKTNKYDNISNSELLDKVKRKKVRNKNAISEEERQTSDNFSSEGGEKLGIKLVKKNNQFVIHNQLSENEYLQKRGFDQNIKGAVKDDGQSDDQLEESEDDNQDEESFT
eukprot:TRINITY_DN3971_c0_g1_i3.p1 TRINITY_DN3971_c0_g1~~TRINITY_DN3971_c0_g1_i3.p1  ORF type:complete len:283 (+),score=31.92 TRINITY_DN3971_c0_g1_i3:70-918(+)